jgi:hypothetical protein
MQFITALTIRQQASRPTAAAAIAANQSRAWLNRQSSICL